MELVPKLPHKVQYVVDYSLPIITRLTDRNRFDGGRIGYPKELLFGWLLVKKVMHWDYRTVGHMAGVAHTTLVRFNQRCLDNHVYERLLQELVKRAYKQGLIQGKHVAMDSSFVKTFSGKEEAGSGGYNGHKEAYGFKLHLLVDAVTGYPIALIIDKGTPHDSQYAIPLLRKARPWLRKVGYVLADKGYDDSEIVDFTVKQLKAKAGIPIKKTNYKQTGRRAGNFANWRLKANGRTVKHSILNLRTEVERCFSTLKRAFHLGHEATRGIAAFTKNVYLSLICFMLRKLYAVGVRKI